MRAAWFAEALRLSALIAIGVLGGALAGYPTSGLIIALLFYVGWHLRQLRKLELWLGQSGGFYPPEAEGIWGEVLHQLYRLRRRNRRRKQRIARLVREFRMSTAAMPDGILLLNQQQEIVWYNATALELLELAGPKDVGQRVSNLIRDPEFQRYLGDGATDGEALEVEGTSGRRLSLQLVPYGDDQWLLVVKDITRMRELERMRTDFVANASHELRSPLTVLSGYLETMREDEGLREHWGAPLDEMHRQAERMQDIVEGLLELSRLEGEDEPTPDEEVEAAGLLAQVAEDARELARPGQEVLVDADPDLLLLGSEIELRSAFSNLVLNAIKYTPEGGRIEVALRADGDGAVLAVSDTGRGIPEEHIPRLTERFYRVDRGRSRGQGGVGLGLAIVKYALQRHGAELSVSSRPGEGSRFSCRFPAAVVRRRTGAA